MNFEIIYDSNHEAFRESARAWFDETVPVDITTPARGPAESARKYALRRAFGRKLGEKGWLFPWAPLQYGGGGLDADYCAILEQEANRHNLNLPPYYDSGGLIGGPTILKWGTEEQKNALLPPIFKGEVRTWQLLSEPSAGSDLASVKTTATLQEDGSYILNGQKVYVGHSNGADRLWVVAVTDTQAPRYENLGWFMIDADLAGIDIHPQFLLSDLREDESDCGHKNTVFFDNVRVSGDRLIGGHNNGWRVAKTHLGFEHGGFARINRDPIWAKLIDYCDATICDGRPLSADPAIQSQLVDIFIRLETLRLLGIRNHASARAGRKLSYEGPQYSHAKKETGLWLTKAIQDLFGPSALTSDEQFGALAGDAEIQQRQGVVFMHPGGTADIQRMLIARGLGVGRPQT